MTLLTENDWDAADILLQRRKDAQFFADYIAYKAGFFWMVVRPDYREEVAGPYATCEEAEKRIEVIETSIAEAQADFEAMNFDAVITPQERHFQAYTEKYR